MSSNRQISITLPDDTWKRIVLMIDSGSKARGGQYIDYGREAIRIIIEAIEDQPVQGPARKIERILTGAGYLHSVGYDPETQTLEIQFNNGSVYQYYGVPQQTYNELVKRKYDGEHYGIFIRRKFQNKQIDKEPIEGQARFGHNGGYPDYYHNSDFGEWVDTGNGEVWDSYVDDD